MADRPNWPQTPGLSWGGVIVTANTAMDGTGTVELCFTAGTGGAFLDFLDAIPIGSNAATVLRVFDNNGSTPTVAANNTLIGELTCPITTLSQVAAMAAPRLQLNRSIPAGHRIYCTIGATIAAGIKPAVQATQYV